MRIIAALLLLSIPATPPRTLTAQYPTTCVYSSDCHPDQCYATNPGTGLGECHAKQYAVMVWSAREKGCLTDLKIAPETTMEAPMDNGTPDMSQSKILHLAVKYRPECGRIEIRTR